nr:unnamed protein product [Digitaria exilis]
MDTGELQRLGSLRHGGSTRGSSSSIWRQRGDDVLFSRSRSFSRESGEDDEEALRWAALEKLPTFVRLQRAVLPPVADDDDAGAEKHHPAARVVDVRGLGPHDRRELVERLVHVAEEDNERFLLKLKDRVERCVLPSSSPSPSSVGLDLPTIEVRFENLAAEAEVRVGSSGLPTLVNSITNKLEEAANAMGILPSRKRTMTVLHDISGIIKPHRMTLLLGPPGSGKTTLLLALAGRLDKDLKASAIEGEEVNVVTDYVLKILGLEICADTMVGDEMRRGISGGQRKRVTTGEMLVGPARALFMDEISTGLDSSTTFQIVKSIRQFIHILGGTAIISLLQPAPETYDLFDDIILLSDGQIVYQGPQEDVLEFFESVGFKCPERKGIADFLQEVSSRKDQKQYWARLDEPYQYVTVKQLSSSFQSFRIGRAIKSELSIPFDKSNSHPAALTTTRYGVSAKELLKANIDREILLIKRNSFVYIFRAFQLILLSTITMTVFIRTKMHRDSVTDGGIYVGVLVIILIVIMFNGMSELALTVFRLPVFFKQRNLRFYPAWAYTIPSWILKVPISFIEVGGFVFMAYYVIGFDPNVGSKIDMFSCLRGTLGSKSNGMNAIVVNEFLGHSWHKIVNNSISNETLGVQILKSHGFFSEAKWYWIGLGAMLGFTLLFNSLFTLALKFLEPYGKSHPSISEEILNEKDANLNGKVLSGSLLVSGSSTHQAAVSTSPISDSAINEDGSGPMTRGMVLSFVPLSLTFDDIRYFVDMPQEMKVQGITEDRLELLKGVSGSFRPGVLTALMGVSGAAWLRLPVDVDPDKRKMFIEEVMNLVELKSIRDALVGLPGVDGLSTEQRKRLTIGVELVANPSIIFMDEPTSGLDARAAAIVMRALFLMKRGGEEIYVGPLGHHSSELIKYFEGIQGISKIRDGYNPATWMLEVTTISQEQALGVDFSDIYKKSELYMFLFTIVIALLFGTIYWDLGGKIEKPQDLSNAMGSMYGASLFIGTLNSASVQPVVAVERTVFYRERAAGMYSAFPYAFGQVVIELPYGLVQASIYGIIVYAMIGFEWSAAKFFWYLFFMYFTLLYYTFYVSQFGDVTKAMVDGTPVNVFVENYFGFKHSWLGIVAAVVVAFTALFAFSFAFAIMKLNFQTR